MNFIPLRKKNVTSMQTIYKQCNFHFNKFERNKLSRVSFDKQCVTHFIWIYKNILEFTTTIWSYSFRTKYSVVISKFPLFISYLIAFLALNICVEFHFLYCINWQKHDNPAKWKERILVITWNIEQCRCPAIV